MLFRKQAPILGWMRWTVLGLCTLLVLGVFGGATASQVQIYGKSVYAGHVLGSSHDGRQTVRGQLHQAKRIRKNVVRRSLDLEAFNIHMTPTTSKINLPTIIKLFPPTAKPLHMTNMPLRFGRNNSPSPDQPSNDNMPLRFGRDNDAHLPLRFGRDSHSGANAPLRFGRAGETRDSTARMFGRPGRGVRVCLWCSTVERQLLGLYWSLLRTIHTY